MTALGKILTIAGNSLRRVMRDRTAIVFIILLPFFIILVIGTATAGFEDERWPVGITSGGSGRLTDDLVRTISRSRSLDVERVADADDLRKGVRRGVYAAGVVIPDTYERVAARGRGVEVTFLADLSRGMPSVVRAAVSAAVVDQGARLQAASFATKHTDRTFEDNLAEARRVEGFLPEVSARSERIGERSANRFVMSGFEYTAPSNLILFVFITSLAGSGMIIQSRQLGVSRRMYGTPTTAGQIIAGETIGRFALALFQALYIVVLGVAVFGVNWGNTAGAVAVVTLFVLVGTSFSVLAGTVFRNSEQAGSIGPPVGIAMGMLAGCMWPRFVMPEAMQRLGQAFPHAWAMDAFIKLIARGAGIGDIVGELAVLAAFVVVLLPLATWRLRRSITA